ncbi:Tail-specific protease [BD1-7 clade bacterium]|uniref:Tail-specific protease n=1 Tax=BD1-7 clade bacterium TaxID=2029982 RepID=A0A5S9QNI4_9GAMM|nr:Tail-specific protease [BD1-7 clade bacterium]
MNISTHWKKKAATVAFLALSVTPLGVSAANESNPGKLTPSPEHKQTTIEVLEILDSRHFEDLNVDSTLSKEFLDHYIDSVDANRQIFLESDVEGFDKRYASSLDNRLKKGDVAPAYSIFNLYQIRLINELDKVIANLPASINGFDYKKKESMIVDRSKAGWPKTMTDVDDLWRKRVKSAALAMKLQGKTNDEIIETLTKRYKNQLERVKKLNSEDVYQIYMNSFTELYDPHTNYMSPSISKNFDISMSLKLQGIGAMLRMKDDHTEVVRLIPGGPASKQGELRPSDQIVGVAQGVDGEMQDVVGWRLDEVVDLIRGKKGTKVRLEVIPAASAGGDTREQITITRDEVKLEEQSVKKAMLDVKDSEGVTRKIGVLDIPAFYIDFDEARRGNPNYKSTTRDTAKLLNELVREGAEGIIIDLRNNGGGSLREANELTGLFIDKGPSVQIKTSSGRIHLEQKPYFSPYYDKPVVVLINRMSASASEIFAGALQDYARALVIGTDSFGKGTVQSLQPLSHGKLKITESKFYRISGDSTQNRGVVPDVELPAIYDSELVGEGSQDKAMKWDSIAPVINRRMNDYTQVIPLVRERSAKRVAGNEQFQYFNEKMDYQKSLRVDEISLNLDERKNQTEKDKQVRLELTNKQRVAKDEKPFESYDIMEEELKKKDAEDNSVNKIELDDPYLIEAAAILLDTESIQHHEVAKNAKKK